MFWWGSCWGTLTHDLRTLDVKSLQKDRLNYKIVLPVRVITPGPQPFQLFFCLHKRSYITSCYNGIEHRGQMEPAPQGEMWLDDTQMAHTVETSICLCIKTTGFIGVFEDYMDFSWQSCKLLPSAVWKKKWQAALAGASPSVIGGHTPVCFDSIYSDQMTKELCVFVLKCVD